VGQRGGTLGHGLSRFALNLTATGGRLQEILDLAAQAVADLVGDGSSARLVDEDGCYGPCSVAHPEPEIVAAVRRVYAQGRQHVDEGYQQTQVRSNAALFVDPVTPDWLRSAMPGPMGIAATVLPLRALCQVPLVAGEEYLGYLTAFRTEPGRHYTDADVALLTDIGSRLTLAVSAARSMERLRASEERYRRIVESTAEGIWQIDAAGTVVFANEHLARMVGIDRDKLIGRSASEFLDEQDRALLHDPLLHDPLLHEPELHEPELHEPELHEPELHEPELHEPELREPVPSVLGPGCATSAARRHEVRVRRHDQSVLWGECVAVPITDESGTLTGMLGMLTDISDRVRSRELERQLDQMSRLDSLGQLAGGISHDFKNLLLVVGGLAQVMQDHAEPGSSLAGMASQIAAAAKRGDELTSRLLAFSRGSSARPEVLDLGRALAEVEPMLRRILGEHVALVVCPAPPGAWPVYVNQSQLEQVVVNLAANARDAMPDGGRVTIEWGDTTLDTTSLQQDGQENARFVRLAVSDNGQGMDAETRRRAFEPFFTTKERGKGTGLGLATVYGLVRSSHGYVRLYSEAGGGTTVKVYLPAAGLYDHAAAEAGGSASNIPAGLRVYVVEDQPDVADVVAAMLRSEVHLVGRETDPVRALAALRDGLAVDVLLTDVIMPGMTGPQLVAALQQDRPGLPVVYMSGHTAGVLGERGNLPGGAEMVEKPFTRETVLEAIARVLPDGRKAG
jgi:two-component system, cell cycle sensor histidine kinase and response regulator CckA